MGVSSSATEYCLTAGSRSGAYFGYSSRLGPVRKSTPIDPASCS